jgi:hypothetical protein
MDLKQQKTFCRENYVYDTVYRIKRHFEYSQKHQCDNVSPQPAHHLVYQKDTTVASYQKVFESETSDKSYKYCTILTSDPWGEYIKDPFNKDKTKAYLGHTALE